MGRLADCIVCDILGGYVPRTVVYRDADCAAFMDIQRVNAGHVLVVRPRHAEFMGDLDAPTAGRLLQAAQRVAAAPRASGLPCEGVTLFLVLVRGRGLRAARD